MATTTAKFPQSATTAAESPWLDDDWVSPTDIYADDTSYASVTSNTYDPPDQTYVLKAYNFDFSAIPDGATILGVTCVVSAWTAAAKVQSLDLCQLLDTSLAKVGTNMAATPIQVGTVEGGTLSPIGGSVNLWGNALTPSWVKNSNFGVALGFVSGTANSDIFVDYVTLEIEYSSEDYSGSASISGNGSLSGSPKKGGKGALSASAAGMLAALGMVAMLGTAAIAGNGSLAGAGIKATSIVASVSGGGSLIATGEKSEGESHSGVASISGGGATTAVGNRGASGIVSVSGNGTLAGTGTRHGYGTGGISFTGSLTGTGTKHTSDASVISGGGSLTATGFKPEEHTGVAIITGSGSLGSDGDKGALGAGSISHGDVPAEDIIMLTSGQLAKRISDTLYLEL